MPYRKIDGMRIVVIGLGYVGLPLAVRLAENFETWGLDIDPSRIEELKGGFDRTGEIDAQRLGRTTLNLAADCKGCPPADAYIITVPTPIDSAKRPDLAPVIGATKMAAGMLDPDRRPVIIFESTVYPGVTEDICRPLIAEISGLVPEREFSVGYSPERINPGDREHTVDKIAKVIAGEDDRTTEILASIYGQVTTGGVFRAASIKAAEAAKVIENAQRDINIAFVNEITQIFAELDLSIWDVLDAANTKWNFLPFQPGLVGGHCIGVDPYYLSHLANRLGHGANVILSGRETNDGMAAWIAQQIHSQCADKTGRILVLGLTFKENVPDLRNSKVADLVGELQKLGHEVIVHDPLANSLEAAREYGLTIAADALSQSYHCIVGAVSHRAYREMSVERLGALLLQDGLVFDLKRLWPSLGDKTASLPAGQRYCSL